LEIAVYSGLEFEKIPANWDSLLAGMKEKKFDAVITSLPPYSYNMAKYNFSQNFLDLGPVLVVPMGAKLTELSHMEGELVGVIAGDPSVLLLQKYGDIIVRNYPGIPDLLDAIVAGEIQAALLSQIPAVSYVKDLYQGQLKIASEPLTQEGLHLASPKENEQVVRLFNKSLDQMKKKKKIQMLLKKWQLCE
jgi:ABC-type amino acid transport substrate-binding protein